VPSVDHVLVPDVRRVHVDVEPDLLAQFPAKRGKVGLAGLNASAGCRPRNDRPGRPGNDEATQQDAVLLVEKDRTDGATQIHP
jgi:hypothetical protein